MPSNVAAGKTVTSSDGGATGLTFITDASLLATDYAVLTSGAQWVKIDLGVGSGSGYTVNEVKLWHYYDDGRTYHDVIVQLSNTSDFSSGVTTVFNNDANNSAGQGTGSDAEYAESVGGKSITFSAVTCRYVRCWTNGSSANDGNHYVEIEVWGDAASGLGPGMHVTLTGV